ncbi:hypothetical protein GCM10009753_33060 [Streptantibioticus ferralitis]
MRGGTRRSAVWVGDGIGPVWHGRLMTTRRLRNQHRADRQRPLPCCWFGGNHPLTVVRKSPLGTASWAGCGGPDPHHATRTHQWCISSATGTRPPGALLLYTGD